VRFVGLKRRIHVGLMLDRKGGRVRVYASG
jgi:hypothetical protein